MRLAKDHTMTPPKPPCQDVALGLSPSLGLLWGSSHCTGKHKITIFLYLSTSCFSPLFPLANEHAHNSKEVFVIQNKKNLHHVTWLLPVQYMKVILIFKTCAWLVAYDNLEPCGCSCYFNKLLYTIAIKFHKT